MTGLLRGHFRMPIDENHKVLPKESDFLWRGPVDESRTFQSSAGGQDYLTNKGDDLSSNDD